MLGICTGDGMMWIDVRVDQWRGTHLSGQTLNPDTVFLVSDTTGKIICLNL